jgi:choline dehydrogenase-like flavoprotein
LSKKGIHTLILESGTGMGQWLFDRRVRRLAEYEHTGDTCYPVTKTKARLLGGNSNFWTGRSERFHPSDFESHPYTPSDNPWPIAYPDLDRYYERAEMTLRVRGGLRSSFAPPRGKTLPLPPSPDISYLKDLFLQAGIQADDSPTATPARSLRFFRVQKEILPSFLKSSNGKVLTNATVTKLLVNSSGSVTGAAFSTLAGHTGVVRSRIFVVAAGGIETPRLLLLSRSDQFPTGIGNNYDRVGRFFNEHPTINFYSRIHHELRTILPTNKIGRTHQLYSHFRSDGLGAILPVFRQAWILPHHVMPSRISKLPRHIRSMFTRFVRPVLYLGVTTEMKPCPENRVTLSTHRVDSFGNPIAHLIFNFSPEDLQLLNRCRELARSILTRVGATHIYESDLAWSRHHQGTCRMGADPKTSVVDKNLKVHDCPNLYLCGAEVFVTGGAMQPVLTIAALAHRLADHLDSYLVWAYSRNFNLSRIG